MKSFIVAALLVAAVAGQSIDTIMKLNKEKSLLTKFDRPLESDLLWKQKLSYPWEKTWTYGDNMEYTKEELLKDKIYQLEEIMEHELFREYMTLPLFRQFWKYPTFQKYVTSVYFQHFWKISAFKNYFLNPVLFYKYIYPIVTLFKSDITYPYTHNYYGDETIENKNLFPVVTGFERDLLKDKYTVPTMYNEELKLKDELLLKHLIVKIYSHLYNIPEEIVLKHFLTTPMTEEYKNWEPTYKTWEPTTYKPWEKTYKTWEPTTYKTWEKTWEPTSFKPWEKTWEPTTFKPWEKTWEPTTYKTWEPTIYGEKLNKDVLLKKYLLNKMIMGEETFKTHTPEEVILREKMMKMNPFVHRMLFNKHVPTYKFDTVEKMSMFDIPMKKEFIKDKMTKELIKDEMTKELIKDEMKKELIKDELKKEMFLKDKMNTFESFETPKVVDFPTPMMGVKTFDKKVYPETMIKV